jgi:hypothetical protein
MKNFISKQIRIPTTQNSRAKLDLFLCFNLVIVNRSENSGQTKFLFSF